jgi:hypothetical protein
MRWMAVAGLPSPSQSRFHGWSSSGPAPTMAVVFESRRNRSPCAVVTTKPVGWSVITFGSNTPVDGPGAADAATRAVAPAITNETATNAAAPLNESER